MPREQIIDPGAFAGPSNDLHSQGPEHPEDHALAIVEDIIVPDSKDLQAGDRFEILLALVVLKAPIIMAPTIELDDQSMGTAIEVHDIGADGMLASEFHATQSAVAEQFPEDALRERGVPS